MDTSIVRDRYRRFAEVEAHGSSPLFEDWAFGLADDAEVRELVVRLPADKRQPNLIFAAARVAGVPLMPWAQAREDVIARWTRIELVVRERSTQTNEPARCAALLAALGEIPGPLALIEVGVSAGLCLYPDRYAYRFETDSGVTRLGTGPVEIACRVIDAAPPSALPEVVWRAGIDLNPLDPTDPDAMAWLETLVWPEHEDRRRRIHAAATIAAADPPHLVRGDLVAELPALVAQAPENATVVVFHSAVLAYLSEHERRAFEDLVTSLPVRWISNEAAGVFPDIAARLPSSIDPTGRFLLALDGDPLALTHPHGRDYRGFPRGVSGT